MSTFVATDFASPLTLGGSTFSDDEKNAGGAPALPTIDLASRA
jgi:hypothetical protein